MNIARCVGHGYLHEKARLCGLDQFLIHLGHHPVIVNCDEVSEFIGFDGDRAWERL